MKDVYVTRDSMANHTEIWPARVGIRKFHGCIEWGAAWSTKYATSILNKGRKKLCECLYDLQCRERFGFYPEEGTAWLIEYEGKKMKRTKVDIEFSP